MNTKAEIIRSITRWALVTISRVESARERVPGPRLSEMQLGRLVYRKDVATALALAADIGYRTDRDLTALISEIRSGWGTDSALQRRRGSVDDSYEIACRLMRELRSLLDESQERLLLYACTMKTWVVLEQAFPGRNWVDLRKTFESMATLLYDRHVIIVMDTADYITKIATPRR